LSYIVAALLSAVTVSEITEDSVAELQLQIPDKGVITLHFVSPGGDVFAGLELIRSMEAAKARGVRFVCVAEVVASMAMPIFATCDDRRALPRALFMTHGAAGAFRGNAQEARAAANFMEAIDDALNLHIVRAMNITADELERRVDAAGGEYWFTSAEARALGFVR
jgi:ATP-dependent protease ClpP protease subunit